MSTSHIFNTSTSRKHNYEPLMALRIFICLLKNSYCPHKPFRNHRNVHTTDHLRKQCPLSCYAKPSWDFCLYYISLLVMIKIQWLTSSCFASLLHFSLEWQNLLLFMALSLSSLDLSIIQFLFFSPTFLLHSGQSINSSEKQTKRR